MPAGNSGEPITFMKPPLDPRRIEVVDDDLARVLRTKTPAEKFQMILRINRRLRIAVEGYVRSLHPDWTAEQVWQEVVRRMHGGTR